MWERIENTIFLLDTAGNPEGKIAPHLLARVANHSAVFASSCPLTELAMNNELSIIKKGDWFNCNFQLVKLVI